jgi:Transcription factor regulating root and shoot growth via Pin3
VPYPNEHAARIHSPGQYVKFRRDNGRLGPGIDAIFGIKKDGSTDIQAIRFDKTKYTAQQARHWLKTHKFKPIAFEPAAAPKKGP